MTDRITELAKQAGFQHQGPQLTTAIKRFAELVRAEALEDAAKVCEAEYDNWDNERPLRICATAIRGLKK